MTKTKLSAAICVLASMGATSALAQTQAAAIKLGGGVNFVPSVNLDVQYDDNVTSAERDETESWVTILNPNFELSAEGDKSAYRLNYSVTQGEYYDSDDDNFTDHEITAEAAFEFTARHRLSVFTNYLDGHEARGQGFSQGAGDVLSEPDQYQDTDVKAIYSFGAETAKGKLDLELGTRDRDFEGGERTESRDRGTDYGTVTFRYNVGGRTELIAEVAQRDIAYDVTAVGADELDSTEIDYLVGITWEGTAKTTGTVKVGHREKNFDSASREDFDGARWEANITWTPRTYSTFSFTTSRKSEETNGSGDFIDTDTHSVSWNHAWAQRLSSTLSYNYSDKTYEGSVDGREEELNGVNARLDYQLRRWLNVNAGVTYTDQDSTAAGSSYERTLFVVGFQASL